MINYIGRDNRRFEQGPNTRSRSGSWNDHRMDRPQTLTTRSRWSGWNNEPRDDGRPRKRISSAECRSTVCDRFKRKNPDPNPSHPIGSVRGASIPPNSCLGFAIQFTPREKKYWIRISNRTRTKPGAGS